MVSGSATSENANISFDFNLKSVSVNFGINNMSTEKSRRSSVNRKSGASDATILPDRQSVATILPDRKSVASNVTVLLDDLTDEGSPIEADVDKENHPTSGGGLAPSIRGTARSSTG